MSGRLILLRHGQSHANVERRLDTAPPGARLTDLGREQARGFARARGGAPGLLVHSVAHRAAETAAEISAAAAITPGLVEGIHEVQAGDLENRTDDAAITEFAGVYRRWHAGELDAAMPGGESGREVLDRYLPAIGELRVRYLDEADWTADIVVVSHGAAIRLAAAALTGIDREFAVENHLGNIEAVTLVPVDGGGWRCVQWGSQMPGTVSAADPMG